MIDYENLIWGDLVKMADNEEKPEVAAMANIVMQDSVLYKDYTKFNWEIDNAKLNYGMTEEEALAYVVEHHIPIWEE